MLLRLQSVTSHTFKAKQLRVLMKLFQLCNRRKTVALWMFSVKAVVVSCIPLLHCDWQLSTGIAAQFHTTHQTACSSSLLFLAHPSLPWPHQSVCRSPAPTTVAKNQFVNGVKNTDVQWALFSPENSVQLFPYYIVKYNWDKIISSEDLRIVSTLE